MAQVDGLEIKDNKLYWAPHPEDGYVLGRVVDIAAESISLARINSREVVKSDYKHVLPSEEYENYPDDNCGLMFLNEATLLNNVRQRYLNDKIYTYVANILISVNPYSIISELYTPQVMRSYVGKSIGSVPPHVYAIADKAYRELKIYKESQAIIVSGESGAGKTEATKHLIRYLTECYGSKAGSIEQRIVESNPLLEAFGNAKTLRNNNSSRFGKFIEIHFNTRHQVTGGQVVHYLLEKSRVVSQSPQERNYHIFYRLCAGAPPQLRQKLHLKAPDYYQYLKNGCTSYFVSAGGLEKFDKDQLSAKDGRVPLHDIEMDDMQDFASTEKAMQDMGIDSKVQMQIFSIIAGLLHLGNVRLEEGVNTSGSCEVPADCQESLTRAGTLLGLSPEVLQTALTSKTTSTTRDELIIALKPTEAVSARDAMAKAIYSKLFEFIVACVNRAIPLSGSSNYIGILDIAGFEYFEHNSFEQFCINYCNEKLQQFFNCRVLKDEQELYQREGLGLKKIDFIDNQDCIDLIEKKPISILDLLDEESRLPKSSVEHFTDEVHSKLKGHSRLDIPRRSKLKVHRELRDNQGFLIRHFAGAVCYSTANFLDKNNDALHASLEAAIAESTNPLIQNLFAASADSQHQQQANSNKRGGAGRLNFISLGSKFRSQLKQLLDKLDSTGTSFVRCIKPNSRMVSHMFEGSSCLSQLQCSGMTDVLSVMEQGFPSRTPFADLYNMYKSKLSVKLAQLEPRVFCKLLFKALGLSDCDFRFGTTRVFFRPGKFSEFDQLLQSDPAHLATLVQKVHKWLITYRWKLAIYGTIEVVKLKNKILWRRQMHVRIQKHIRGWLTRRRLRPLIRVMLQSRSWLEQLAHMTRAYQQMKSKVGQTGQQEIDQLKQKIFDYRQSLARGQWDKWQERAHSLQQQVQQAHDQLAKAAEQDRVAQIEAKRAGEQAEKDRKKRQAEEEAQRLAVQERQMREEMERRRKEEEEAMKSQAVQLAALRAEEEQSRARSLYQAELERRDRELAVRISNGDRSAVDESNAKQAASTPAGVNSKYAYVINWSYTELRQAIHTSTDIQMLEACKDEFHRRIKAFQEWKESRAAMQVNNTANGGQGAPVIPARQPATGMNSVRAPREVISYAANEGKLVAQAMRNGGQKQPGQGGPEEQRFFKFPLSRQDTPNEGFWYAHFSGRYVIRQMQLVPGSSPILYITGVHDINMCEIPLEETGLTRRKGSEILEREFNTDWDKHGGQLLLKRFVNQITHPQLKRAMNF